MFALLLFSVMLLTLMILALHALVLRRFPCDLTGHLVGDLAGLPGHLITHLSIARLVHLCCHRRRPTPWLEAGSNEVCQTPVQGVRRTPYSGLKHKRARPTLQPYSARDTCKRHPWSALLCASRIPAWSASVSNRRCNRTLQETPDAHHTRLCYYVQAGFRRGVRSWASCIAPYSGRDPLGSSHPIMCRPDSGSERNREQTSLHHYFARES